MQQNQRNPMNENQAMQSTEPAVTEMLPVLFPPGWSHPPMHPHRIYMQLCCAWLHPCQWATMLGRLKLTDATHTSINLECKAIGRWFQQFSQRWNVHTSFSRASGLYVNVTSQDHLSEADIQSDSIDCNDAITRNRFSETDRISTNQGKRRLASGFSQVQWWGS